MDDDIDFLLGLEEELKAEMECGDDDIDLDEVEAPIKRRLDFTLNVDNEGIVDADEKEISANGEAGREFSNGLFAESKQPHKRVREESPSDGDLHHPIVNKVSDASDVVEEEDVVARVRRRVREGRGRADGLEGVGFQSPTSDGHCVSISSWGGLSRWYFTFKSKESVSSAAAALNAAPTGSKVVGAARGLLTLPYQELIASLEQARYIRASNVIDVVLPPVAAQRPCNVYHPTPETRFASSMWVDKYCPHKFLELLSDDSVNRDVLAWIKKWDSLVFPTKSKQSSRGKSVAKKSNVEGPIEEHPPILLLCGPPGVGKTTLAHVAARHAGYNVVEINASDDRTATTLVQRVRDATEMKPLFGDHRPNLIVLDEIDGAADAKGEGKSSIAALLELVSGHVTGRGEKSTEKLTEADSPDGEPPSSTKPRNRPTKKPHGVRRPIICICNDEFAAVLRPLKASAMVLRVPELNSTRVSQRAREIALLEGVKVEPRACLGLSEATGNDIRAVLHTLQFLSARERQRQLSNDGDQTSAGKKTRRRYVELTCNVIAAAAASIGAKDEKRGLLEIWDAIFCRDSVRKLTLTPQQRLIMLGGGLPVYDANDASDAFSLLYATLSAHGDVEMITRGVQELVPEIRFTDPDMTGLADCCDLLAWNDQLHHRLFLASDASTLPYLPLPVIGIHHIAVSVTRPRLHFPRQETEARRLLESRQQITRALLASLSPMCRSLSCPSERVLVTDCLTFLLQLWHPKSLLQAGNTASPDYRVLITNLAKSIYHYGVTFIHKSLTPSQLLTLSASSVHHQHTGVAWFLTPSLWLLLSFGAGVDAIEDSQGKPVVNPDTKFTPYVTRREFNNSQVLHKLAPIAWSVPLTLGHDIHWSAKQAIAREITKLKVREIEAMSHHVNSEDVVKSDTQDGVTSPHKTPLKGRPWPSSPMSSTKMHPSPVSTPAITRTNLLGIHQLSVKYVHLAVSGNRGESNPQSNTSHALSDSRELSLRRGAAGGVKIEQKRKNPFGAVIGRSMSMTSLKEKESVRMDMADARGLTEEGLDTPAVVAAPSGDPDVKDVAWVTFLFQEGFTQAVRATVTMRDFLQ